MFGRFRVIVSRQPETLPIDASLASRMGSAIFVPSVGTECAVEKSIRRTLLWDDVSLFIAKHVAFMEKLKGGDCFGQRPKLMSLKAWLAKLEKDHQGPVSSTGQYRAEDSLRPGQTTIRNPNIQVAHVEAASAHSEDQGRV
ncbi:uncharacterized protein N7518_003037 [Penicillium psychrosexuale]|uniref:uncharacterized protein n=1 Tax=Penicillium psychrosexuale TaxID=1002107 RepID=UPI002544FB51|nr:uncharacterized protein N7518_003037 [Penicillium psychrosexuale]KAJ5800969.1 hypothetical protein N7518_003037 [Penicillium psychrosexuale]